jgi:Fic family protein
LGAFGTAFCWFIIIQHSNTRLERAQAHFGRNRFSGKDYLKLYKSISPATASRDLKAGLEAGMLTKKGKKALTSYAFEA